MSWYYENRLRDGLRKHASFEIEHVELHVVEIVFDNPVREMLGIHVMWFDRRIVDLEARFRRVPVDSEIPCKRRSIAVSVMKKCTVRADHTVGIERRDKLLVTGILLIGEPVDSLFDTRENPLYKVTSICFVLR